MSKHGFLLIEIMIALTLFATISVIVAHYYGRIASLKREVYHYGHALTIVRNALETAQYSKQLILPSQEDMTVNHTIIPVRYDGITVDQVTVTVSWKTVTGDTRSTTFISAFLPQKGLNEG